MIRLSIVLVHTVTAAAVATPAALVLLQAVANRRWEMGFYGVASRATTAMLTDAAGLLALAALLAGSSVVWFVGRADAVWGVLVATLALAVTLPLPAVALLVAAGVVVQLDVWVTEHRQRPPTA